MVLLGVIRVVVGVLRFYRVFMALTSEVIRRHGKEPKPHCEMGLLGSFKVCGSRSTDFTARVEDLGFRFV